MLSTTSQKFTVVLVVLLILGAIGYFVYSGAEAEIVEPAELSGQPVYGQDILVLANKINSISIDKSIFTSPLFTSLIDLNIPVVVEPKGRINPFAALSNQGTPTKGGNTGTKNQ